ncbi:MAG TPA: hypothetical protein VMT54_21580 [Candidatus Cybelea sp.]|nr:hypothetical protein [Candidatus Cybelea sp.]
MIGTEAASAAKEAAISLQAHRGWVLSLCLHAVLLGLLVLFGWPRTDDAARQPAITIDLVALGPSTVSPAAVRRSAVPQQPASETSDQISPAAAPAKAVGTIAGARIHSGPAGPAATNGRKAALASAQRAPTSKPGAIESRDDVLTERLQRLAELAEPTSKLTPSPMPQQGTGLSNATASAGTATGPEAVYGLKDFIRAQIIRRWYVADPAPVSKGWTVAVHMKLRPDGTVALAEVVDIGRYQTNRRYFEFALSARNAVLLSSPLIIPPGSYQYVKELVIEFDPRAVLQ